MNVENVYHAANAFHELLMDTVEDVVDRKVPMCIRTYCKGNPWALLVEFKKFLFFAIRFTGSAIDKICLWISTLAFAQVSDRSDSRQSASGNVSSSNKRLTCFASLHLLWLSLHLPHGLGIRSSLNPCRHNTNNFIKFLQQLSLVNELIRRQCKNGWCANWPLRIRYSIISVVWYAVMRN